MIDYKEYTNRHEEWKNLGLDKLKCALWYIDYEIESFSGSRIAPHNTSLHCISIDYLKTKQCWNISPYIFIVDVEGHSSHWVNYKDTIYVWDASFLDSKQFTPYFWWMNETARVEKSVNYASRLIPCNNNSKTFDCLLGSKHTHRDYIYNALKDNPAVLLTYFGADNKWIKGNENDNFVEWDSSEQRIYKGKNVTVNISCFIPWQIYNKTWFSIIAETDPNRTFLTEKTAKPIMARRLFITIGAKGMLKGLRGIGYKTFDTVIDESYDEEDDDQKRWDMAIQQVRYLCTKDLCLITKEIEDITLHNKKCLIEYAEDNHLSNQIREIVGTS